ncbi:photosystem II cytochrome PsbV2 [Leptolyngbya sp. FACHB-261]|uniref:photosystem II cytochrome PsbV2 n=1 Tax=Leptolyngbya sp. FACHB-261 TaxID=2692806 RepID=UPI0028C3D85B|nr:photosystem II cytochrome PsbV2 [Leptolyngbya sp. FACHB-261]
MARSITNRFASWLLLLGVVLGALLLGLPEASAAPRVDPYVAQYLKVKEPVTLPLDGSGAEQTFAVADFVQGKQLFEQNCLNCHVGGNTLPNPIVSLSLADLKIATPPRDTLKSLVTFIRLPMSYDGTEESYACREVPESWLSDAQVTNLAAFILRAAQEAPGWGNAIFSDK